NDGGGGAASGNPSGDGGDGGGGWGGGIPAEVRTVPEPAPFALLMLGFACMYAVRSRKTLFPAPVAAKRRIR
ncbi:MAG: PEP-CTERM sorting domain-containing protein, partial [Betaproteobacteria bacterium]|nr:PEP-CTERM sorting domain-containing protein [Betaproteobacteria bacterium]